MAGREAEEELLGITQGGDGDDQRQIRRMLEKVCLQEAKRDNVERRQRRITRGLVRRHRHKIEALALALIEQRTMSDKQVQLAAGLPPRLRRLSQKEAHRHWRRRALATASSDGSKSQSEDCRPPVAVSPRLAGFFSSVSRDVRAAKSASSRFRRVCTPVGLMRPKRVMEHLKRYNVLSRAHTLTFCR